MDNKQTPNDAQQTTNNKQRTTNRKKTACETSKQPWINTEGGGGSAVDFRNSSETARNKTKQHEGGSAPLRQKEQFLTKNNNDH